jgi:hypothetical protein
MILEGWPETSPPPQGPSKTYTNKPHTPGNDLKMKTPREQKSYHYYRRARIQLRSRLPEDTVDRKQHKYAPLIQELEREGWNVRPTVHVITVGVRATVPIRNVDGGAQEPRY